MKPGARPDPGLAVFWVLSIAAWLGVNVLCALGMLAGLFVLLANANWERFFQESGNLAAHYLAAPQAARADFQQLVRGMLGAAVLAISAARLITLRAGLRSEGTGEKDNAE